MRFGDLSSVQALFCSPFQAAENGQALRDRARSAETDGNRPHPFDEGRRSVDDTTYESFRSLIYANSGIALSACKKTLLMGRVRKRMMALDTVDFRDYLKIVLGDRQELIQLLDAVSTNVTAFFREAIHFQILQEQVLKRLLEGQRRIRIWSAACSSGEEPYTIAMTLLTMFQNQGIEDVDLRILATDLSTRVLARAIRGEYPCDLARPIPEDYKRRFLVPGSQGNTLQIAESVRCKVTFKRLNLVEMPFPMNGPFDAIFCRNVMIYFDDKTRKRLLREFERLVGPGGLVFVGHTESAIAMLGQFQCFRPSVYIKPAEKDIAIPDIARREHAPQEQCQPV